MLGIFDYKKDSPVRNSIISGGSWKDSFMLSMKE